MNEKVSNGADKISLLSVVLLFFVIYGFSISGTDMRYPILIICAVFLSIRFRSICFPIEARKLLAYLMVLCGYATFTTLIARKYDFFEAFRFLRCIASTIVILLFVWGYRIDAIKMVKIIKWLMLLNALAIIAGIIWPEFKTVILPISQYTKSFSQYRSSGLLNGEDAAGFFLMFGLGLETLDNIYNDNRLLNIPTIIYSVASVFVSRMTMVFVVAVLFVDLIISIRNRRYRQVAGLVTVLTPIATIGIVFWIMTTGIAVGLRDSIVNAIPSLGPLFSKLTGSYLDYSAFTTTISRHTSIDDLDFFSIIFGAGYRTGVIQDMGYIKTIYAIGTVGVIAEMLLYFWSIKCILKYSIYGLYERYIPVAYMVLVILMFGWEFKGSFVFSSGFFELLLCVFLSVIYSFKSKYE